MEEFNTKDLCNMEKHHLQKEVSTRIRLRRLNNRHLLEFRASASRISGKDGSFWNRLSSAEWLQELQVLKYSDLPVSKSFQALPTVRM